MQSTAAYESTLARIPFFAGLDSADLERVAAGTRTRRFRRGEVIFHAGDPGDALFIILTGEVKIALPSDEGDEAILATLHEGDVFGELAVLDGAPRSATATALVPTEPNRLEYVPDEIDQNRVKVSISSTTVTSPGVSPSSSATICDTTVW